MPLSEKFDEALVYAHQLHRDQARKGGELPDISHLLALSSFVLERRSTSRRKRRRRPTESLSRPTHRSM